jgi:hypothetical protein
VCAVRTSRASGENRNIRSASNSAAATHACARRGRSDAARDGHADEVVAHLLPERGQRGGCADLCRVGERLKVGYRLGADEVVRLYEVVFLGRVARELVELLPVRGADGTTSRVGDTAISAESGIGVASSVCAGAHMLRAAGWRATALSEGPFLVGGE